jgi:hypothetical protein
LLIVPILKLIKTVLSAWYATWQKMLSTFIFFLSQYVNELFPYGIVEITSRTLTSCVQAALAS